MPTSRTEKPSSVRTNSACRRETVTSSRKMSLAGCRPAVVDVGVEQEPAAGVRAAPDHEQRGAGRQRVDRGLVGGGQSLGLVGRLAAARTPPLIVMVEVSPGDGGAGGRRQGAPRSCCRSARHRRCGDRTGCRTASAVPPLPRREPWRTGRSVNLDPRSRSTGPAETYGPSATWSTGTGRSGSGRLSCRGRPGRPRRRAVPRGVSSPGRISSIQPSPYGSELISSGAASSASLRATTVPVTGA